MKKRMTYFESRDKHTDSSDPETCWEWGGYRDRDGYGGVRFEGVWSLAHRVAYVVALGPIPDGLQIDHLCRNRACVNPAHLEAVTPRENSLRSESLQAVNARKTHCVRGHAFTPDNTQISAANKRRCRACEYIRGMRGNERKRDAIKEQKQNAA